MDLALVIMAAGLGRRFGGNKPIVPVGPLGQTLMDYAIYDAWFSGIRRVVLVTRSDLETQLRDTIGRRWHSRLEIFYAHQRLDALPAGMKPPPNRTIPWGTGQAVLSAAPLVATPFIVINADDFYGRNSFRILADFLLRKHHPHPNTFALVTFALSRTLPPSGRVSRALCRCSPAGELQSLEEIQQIERHGDDARYQNSTGVWVKLEGHCPVSMNLWGFTPEIFDLLSAAFQRFLSTTADVETTEFFLPAAVHEIVHRRLATVMTLSSPETWCGITHAADHQEVARLIAERIDLGQYPEVLWK